MASATTRTVPELLQSIVGNIAEITRSELRLAKVELKEEGAKAKRPAILSVVGGVFALYALGFMLVAGAIALSMVMAWWMATLAVGVALAIVALILLSSASKQFKALNPPERTAQTLKENVEWAQQQIK
jgi:uncharacterized membrane protein YqjE